MEKIRASELRIGNIVCFDKIIESEFPVDWDDIYDLDKGVIELYPIPLTEEWLLKSGFEEADNCLELEINESISIFYAGYLGLMIDGLFVFLEKEQNFVHQLQNLYFALTNEELCIK